MTAEAGQAVPASGPGGPAGAVAASAEVTVLVPSALRTDAGGRSRIVLAARPTLRHVFDALEAAWPRLGRRIRDERGDLRRYVNVYVDGEDCRTLAGQETRVAPGAEIQVLPSVAGGA